MVPSILILSAVLSVGIGQVKKCSLACRWDGKGSSRRMMPWRDRAVSPLLFPQVSKNGIFQGIGLDLY
jgi:hypothetical protein